MLQVQIEGCKEYIYINIYINLCWRTEGWSANTLILVSSWRRIVGVLGLNLEVRVSPSLSWTQRGLFACQALPWQQVLGNP